MSVFVDTGLYYALQNEGANRHDTSRSAFDAVVSGAYGTAFTSDYVFDEAVTLVRARTGDYEEAHTTGKRILGRGQFPDAVSMLFVDRHSFESAVETFERYDDKRLGFTDAATVALVERHDIDHVLSFDDDFDGLVDRLDPTAV